jgi:flagellar basal-body rod modification protein FlgD
MSVETISTSDLLSAYGEGSSYDTSVDDLAYDDFLTLLVAELENQDPLDPMDSSEFTSQLAQFSTVEQLYGMSDTMGDLLDAINAQGEQDLIGLIGTTIKADDNSILVSAGEALSGAYNLEDDGDVTVNIYDEDGWLIRTIYAEDQTAGEYNIGWDGLDDNGEQVDDGTYTFDVTAKNDDGISVEVNAYITGEVTGITYEYSEPYLLLGDQLVSTSQTIVAVNQTESESTAE